MSDDTCGAARISLDRMKSDCLQATASFENESVLLANGSKGRGSSEAVKGNKHIEDMNRVT